MKFRIFLGFLFFLLICVNVEAKSKTYVELTVEIQIKAIKNTVAFSSKIKDPIPEKIIIGEFIKFIDSGNPAVESEFFDKENLVRFKKHFLSHSKDLEINITPFENGVNKTKTIESILDRLNVEKALKKGEMVKMTLLVSGNIGENKELINLYSYDAQNLICIKIKDNAIFNSKGNFSSQQN